MNEALPSSYRDPSGFVFRKNGRILRQINAVYAQDYELLKSSGLYEQLTRKGWLISHEETDEFPLDVEAYKIIRPAEIRTLTYPYEWSISQLRDAALLTLRIQEEALQSGMSLKDATPFNVLFDGHRPVFIDTASFEKADTTRPWVAYHQFCSTFLAPLLLAAYHGPEMIKMLLQYPDGIPLKLCARLLPGKSRLSSLALLHIHLPSRISGGGTTQKTVSFNKGKQERILDHLRRGISALQMQDKVSTWSHYYQESILSDKYLAAKEGMIRDMLGSLKFQSAVDLGCNTGQFSLMLLDMGKKVTASDFDALCIERLYIHCREKNRNITTMITDLMNPSPGIGFENNERLPFRTRAKGELILALALIHHLCISRNLPFSKLAAFLASLGPNLLIEFVPKDDEKVKVLLQHREDIFADYHLEGFRKAFGAYYQVTDERKVTGTDRVLFLMKKRT